MKRKYERRPNSDTKLKSHQIAYAHVFEVVTSFVATRTITVRALSEEQAKEFAANRLRKRSKTLQGFGYDLGEIVEQKVEENDV